jgi:hydroxymethylbilane synthase
MKPVRIATRASALALWQANYVAARLTELGRTSELVTVVTIGDESSAPLRELGVGAFVRGVQQAVQGGRADVAVHSFKDLPSIGPAGLEIAAVPERAAVHDVLLVRPEAFDPAGGALPIAAGARVGTGAARRLSQLAALRSDLVGVPIRGNVPTRVAAAREGGVDAVILAAAGLDRLALDPSPLLRIDLDPRAFLPAPAQGALALEIRRDDPLGDLLADLHHAPGYPLIAAERGLLGMLDAGCSLALGVHATRDDAGIRLHAYFDGRRAERVGANAEAAAAFTYGDLIAGGAR